MNDTNPNISQMETIDFRFFINLVMERLWLITICLISCILLGLGYVTVAPRLYLSKAIIEVEQKGKRVVNIENVNDEDFSGLEVLKTIEQNLQRGSLFQRVMEREEIKNHPRLLRGIADSADNFSSAELAQFLDDWMEVELIRGTRLIEVSVEHRSPELAQKLTEAIVEEYMLEKIQVRSGSSQTAFKFLLDEAERVKSKLQKSEDALQDYKDAIEIKEKIKEQEEELALLSQRYREKHPKMIQANTLITSLKKRFRTELLRVKNRAGKGKAFWENENIDLSKLEGDERIDAELKLMESRFNVLTREVETDRLLYDSIVTRMKETDVTKGLDSTEIQVTEKPGLPLKPYKPRRLLILSASVVLGLSLGLGLVILLNLFDNSLKTVDEAERITGLPVLGAISDDNRIADVIWMKKKGEEGKRILSDLITNAVSEKNKPPSPSTTIKPPKSKNAKIPNKKLEPLVMVSDSGGTTAEAIRSLRASLSLLGRKEDRKTFLVTSAIPGEGKSFVASNLAVAFSQENLETLLIDADLRRPMVHSIFDLQNLQGGVVKCLVEEGGLEKYTIKSNLPHLSLLPVGDKAPNPAELLASTAFAELIEEAMQKYDRIIIDSAPVNAVSDSLLIAPYLQSVCLVIRAGKTPKGAVIRAKNSLAKADSAPAGIVLNRLPSRSGFGSDPYYYYYAAGDGYGKNYGED